jgi:hypothetical protein
MSFVYRDDMLRRKSHAGFIGVASAVIVELNSSFLKCYLENVTKRH